ncbi:MAG: ankyrin repeat domain-containing protein [Deltaproteobacteria bacterium]|nr:ankyrin repeat domain-containing protein [Deltaproteobacteria bacterium]
MRKSLLCISAVCLLAACQEDLHSLVDRGALAALRARLDAGADPNSLDADGLSLLHAAVRAGRVEVVELLLERGARAGSRDRLGLSALARASERGSARMVEALLKAGAPADDRDAQGLPLLYAALRAGRMEIVRSLLARGADPGWKDGHGRGLVHHAARAGQLEMLKRLVEAGADPAARDGQGVTCVHEACARGDLAMLRYLVEDKGLDVFALTDDRRSALDLARQGANADVLSFVEARWAQTVTLELTTSPPGLADALRSSIARIEPGAKIEAAQGSRLRVRSTDLGVHLRAFIRALLDADPQLFDCAASLPKIAYFAHFVLCLPEDLPQIRRHDGYYSTVRCEAPARDLALAARQLVRSPEQLQRLYRAHRERIFELVTPETYVQAELKKSLDALLATWARIAALPDHDALLDASYRRLVEMHERPQLRGSYGWPWCEAIDPALRAPEGKGPAVPRPVSDCWATSFWVRRRAEGNLEAVVAILQDLELHYRQAHGERIAGLEQQKRQRELDAEIARAGELLQLGEIKALAALGADADVLIGVQGIGALQAAALEGDAERLGKLLRDGDPDARDARGHSLMHYARDRAVIDLLVERGVNIDAQDRYGRTALQHARQAGDRELAEALLAAGARDQTPPLDTRQSRPGEVPVDK